MIGLHQSCHIFVDQVETFKLRFLLNILLLNIFMFNKLLYSILYINGIIYIIVKILLLLLIQLKVLIHTELPHYIRLVLIVIDDRGSTLLAIVNNRYPSLLHFFIENVKRELLFILRYLTFIQIFKEGIIF